MSIFKLVNTTLSDITINEDPLMVVKSDQTPFDLVDQGSLDVEDILGVRGGEFYDEIINLINSGDCYLYDGTQRMRRYDALHVIKYGFHHPLDEIWSMAPQESFVLTDKNGWMNSGTNPTWVVAPSAGKELQILSSTTICSRDIVLPDNVCAYFRVFVVNGAVKVYEKRYDSLSALFKGVSDSSIIPQIGNATTTGTPERVIAKTTYPADAYMSLKSSLAMTLVIGLEMQNGMAIDVNDNTLMAKFYGHLSIFLEGRSRDEY